MLDLNVRVGQEPSEIHEEPPGNDDRALALDPCVERRPQRQLHVGSRELQFSALRAHQDTGEDLNRTARRHRTGDDPELGNQLVTRARQLHSNSGHYLCINHLKNPCCST